MIASGGTSAPRYPVRSLKEDGLIAVMDPELAAASVLLERVDVMDQARARANMETLRQGGSSAAALTVGRVDFENRSIAGAEPGQELRVRIYTPTRREGAVPLVMFFHGGAFVMGDLESEHARCLRYSADAGCVVISVEYRLAPEFPFPAGLKDCYRALQWAVSEADELGIDVHRVAVSGTSAGGALATCVAQLARDRGGPKLALQVLVYPVIDDRMATDSMAKFSNTPVWDSVNNSSMWIQYGAGRHPTGQYAVPAHAEDLAGLPTTCIIVAGYDPLRDEALRYADELLAAGVQTEVHLISAAYHGFDQVVPDAEISRRSVDEQIYWIRQFLRP
jgi:acetyl esterase